MVTVERLKEIEASVVSAQGGLDKTWYRGAEGTPFFHNAPGDHVASVEIEMGQKLRDLVVEHKPNVLVDVGTNLGMSSFWMLLGMHQNRKGHLTTYDITDWSNRCHKDFFYNQFGLGDDLVTRVLSPVWDAPLPDNIDFVFHDASHEEDQTQRELEALTPKMSHKSVMAFHDVNLCGHMGKVVRSWFDKHKEWSYTTWDYGRGMGIGIRQ